MRVVNRGRGLIFLKVIALLSFEVGVGDVPVRYDNWVNLNFTFLGDVFRAFHYLTVKVKHAYACVSQTTEDYCYDCI